MKAHWITRRQAIKTALLTTATVAVASQFPEMNVPQAAPADGKSGEARTGPFTLPTLPYAYDALEPHVDTQTMQIHHDKHHAAYVQHLNKAVADYPDLAKKSVEDLMRNVDSIPETIHTAVRNHGGGHANHSLFWQMMSKSGGGQPKSELAMAIDKAFGSYSKFQETFTKTATTVFGSGWAWLSLTSKKELLIESTSNQDSPIMKGNTPLLGIDVWEHAYYLKHQNRRADYIATFYNIINWDFVSERYRTQHHRLV